MSVNESTEFRCFRIRNQNGVISGILETSRIGELPDGDVLISAAYSDVNYKDVLAATGKGKIIRDFPLIGGIDVAGIVSESADERFRPGDAVVVTGCGLGERHDGGFSEYVRVPADWVVRLPDALTAQQSMAIGTAGFTAAQAIDRMEHCGQKPEHGPILVTGATGGVGSIAINMLKRRNYEVVALTGKRASESYLKLLGADEIVFRDELELGTRPLERARFAGAIDSLGGELLSWLTRVIRPSGSIASIGMAGGIEISTTVMPFILRGINLLGIDSVNVPADTRLHVWSRISTDLRPNCLEEIVTRRINLDEIDAIFQSYLDGDVTGRTLVQICRDRSEFG